MATGITKLHSKGCPAKSGSRCRCGAGYEASVISRRDGKKIRKPFARESEAKSWRSGALTSLEQGSLRMPTRTTVRDAWASWEKGAKEGSVTNRSGDPYKPAALRSHERAMRLRVLRELGGTRLTELHRPDVSRLADKLAGKGLSPSTVKCSLLPLRAVCRRAVGRGEIAVNPCDGVELTALRGGRERIAPPEEAERLVADVRDEDRVIWATAMYAGLRRGELQALGPMTSTSRPGLGSIAEGMRRPPHHDEVSSRQHRVAVPGSAAITS